MKLPVRCLLFLTALLTLAISLSVAGQEAADLYNKYKDRIYQIRIIDLEAENKSALGTGFLISRDGLIATNYHVISGLIRDPGKYRLEYIDETGGKGDVRLLDIDVISDLALLQAEGLEQEPLELARQMPEQGETIYSLGNPYDIGFTVIPGTYNGIDRGSYYRHIHFSGSINAGMSGGPVLDSSGRVVGINVSSAGNQVSFLVPVDALENLVINRPEQPPVDFQYTIRRQLHNNQKLLISSMLASEWPVQPLGEALVPGEMQPYVKCWGGSNDEKELLKSVSSSCRSSQQIYLKQDFSTGVISYQFFWLEAGQLSSLRFLTYYQLLFDRFIPDNNAGEDDVTNFYCEEMFVADQDRNTDKVVLCLRAYQRYTGLYDALYLSGSVDQAGKAFISHFTLAGVDRENIKAFMDRFRGVVRR